MHPLRLAVLLLASLLTVGASGPRSAGLFLDETRIEASFAAPVAAQGGAALGTRDFVLGGDSQLFTAVAGGLALGPWVGSLQLTAGVVDMTGAATVTGTGDMFIDVLGGAQGRICRRLRSCAGTVFCSGGVNVDVDATLDSEGCQGVVGGSGNALVVTTMANPTPSGMGAMLLTCDVSDATFFVSEALPDCSTLVDEDFAPAELFVFTTGVSTTTVLNQCGVIGDPDASGTGENFECSAWTDISSGGILVHTRFNEEQAAQAPFDLGELSVLDDVPCGNGVPDLGEECDDGGESVSCDADCTLSVCGDGTVNVAAGETCETDGGCSVGEVCSSICNCILPPVCGNGSVEDGEDCDDSGESMTCDADCTFAVCGDATVNLSAGEACELDLDCAIGEICAPACDCAPELTCGNGRSESGEQCDDGGLTPGDGCDASCQAELPFQVQLANWNLLHNLFVDNDIEDRLGLAADEIAAIAPDILTLQEVTVLGGADVQDVLIADLSARHGLSYFGVRYGDPSAGQAVLSRWPLAVAEVLTLPSDQAVPSFPDRRIFGRVEVDSPIGPLDIYALHFCASCSMAERAVQAGEVVDFIAATHVSGHPALVGADFNSHRGTALDANPADDEAIAVLLQAGYDFLFDGLDSPCDAPNDRSGCTSGQSLRSPTDTTTRRIDNIAVGPLGATPFSKVAEIGSTATFGDMLLVDPNPECAFDVPIACTQTSQCPQPDNICNISSGICEPAAPSCISDSDCTTEQTCILGLWASDHHGVASAVEFVPEPGAGHAALAALLTLAVARSRLRVAARV